MYNSASWLECLDTALSEDFCRDLALSHARLGGAQGKRIGQLIKAGDLRAICEFELELNKPGWDIQELRHCRQALAFFSKNEDLVLPGVDKEENALKKFEASEDACRETNRIFRLRASGGFCFRPKVEGQLLLAQRLIAHVLGPVPELKTLKLRFGKGATTTIRKRGASIREKLSAPLSSSGELAVWVNSLLRELPALCYAQSSRKPKVLFTGDWKLADYSASSGGQIGDCEVGFSVPVAIVAGKLNFAVKNALTYRTTLAEPTLNGMVQMAIGDEMMSRLSRSGLDLRDQTRNQRLALRGSKTGEIATLDLVSASDMNATELVADLLPLDWYLFLARARTGTVDVNGVSRRLEKFSSMGNGFTFPLESLIFWALTIAVCGKSELVSVFGDDIICPAEHAKELSELLAVCGFTVNVKKSFLAGPFRESCGADYYNGHPVRPFYVRNTLNGAGLFLLHNNYYRAGDVAMAKVVESKIPILLRRYGPDGYGDGHLISDDRWPLPPKLVAKGYSGFAFYTYTVKPEWDLRPDLAGDYAYPLYSVYRSPKGVGFGNPVFERKNLLDAAVERARSGTGSCQFGRFTSKFLRGFGTVNDGVVLKKVRVTPVTLHEEIGGYLKMRLDGASYQDAFGSFESFEVTGSTYPLADKPTQYTETMVYTLGN